jgi:outer membrane receptor protein involved in Fe transport
MNRKFLATAICAVLASPYAVGNAYAQDTGTAAQQATNTTEDDQEATSLDRVVVTGSLIPQSQVETASPVITITAEDLQKKGFKNVYDALKQLPAATGSVQDAQDTNTFTPGANTISLLGLDPSFTLVLMNGRPLADYPLLYNSNSNFVDLATIPSFLVERIDILPGNQSAVYGSAAIAGVVNIITKKNIDGYEARVRLGAYDDGGGRSEQFSISGGHNTDRLTTMFGLEYSNQDPIFGKDRDFLDSTLDNPIASQRIAQRDRVIIDAFDGRYVDPGQARCDRAAGLQGGDLEYQSRPRNSVSRPFDYYCGSFSGPGFSTFMNDRKDVNIFGSVAYRFNDSAEVYADVLHNSSKVKLYGAGTQFWANGVGEGSPAYLFDIDSGHLLSLAQHLYAPEELGGLADSTIDQEAYVVNVGLRGALGDSNWDYDVYYHRSAFKTDEKSRRALTGLVDDFFLGEQDGFDPYFNYYPAYHLDSTKFWGAVTPEEFLTYTDINRSESSTYSQQLGATLVNTNLFEMPAGPVGFAAVVEAGNQYWDNPVDPRVTAGDFWGTGGTSGQGKRDRQAIGAEISIPLDEMLTANVSARYDRYSASGNSQGKITYKLGMEFRPTDTLLLRGNYATAFRAPDMGYIFSQGSVFFTSVEDVYNCRINEGDNYTTCDDPYDSVQIQGGSTGNPDLKYITAESFGLGFVWSPSSAFSLKGDFYNVQINNEVASYSLATILEKEADCRLGHTSAGVPVNINSPSCQQFLSQVERRPLDATFNPGALLSVQTVPINVASENVRGIVANATYRMDTDRLGLFTLALDYNTTLSQKYKQFPDDELPYDYLRANDYYAQFKDIATGSLSWEKDDWSATLYGVRYGPTWNLAGTGKVAPWMVYNASVQWNPTEDMTISLVANNVLNNRPPKDDTFNLYPYYNPYNYNPYGRLYMLEVAYRFGQSK